MKIGGIVLCGGQSRRMGRDKAWLPIGSEAMLQRIVRIIGSEAAPLVVVAAAAARLPELPPEVHIEFDRRPKRGPLEGLAAGLAAIFATTRSGGDADGINGCSVDAAYVTSCDVPLIVPAFVRRMVELLGDAEAAVPKIDGRLHPLAAVYRLSILPEIERRLSANQFRMTDLVESLATRFVDADQLSDADPQFQSLRNINEPAEYGALFGTAPPTDRAD